MKDRAPFPLIAAWVMVAALVGLGLSTACSPLQKMTIVPTPTLTTPSPTATMTMPAPTPTLVTPTATPQSEPPVLWVWHDLPQDQADELIRVIGVGQPSPTSVRLELRRYEDEAALERSLTDGMIAFDMALVNARGVGFMRSKGLLQSVEALFGEDFWRNLAPPGMQAVTAEGHIWGVPHTLGMELMLFYNVELVPTPPADTLTMIQIAKKLTRPGQYGLGMNALDPLWAIPWLSAYGGWPTDDAGHPTLQTDPMTRTLAFLRDLAYESRVMVPTMDYESGLAAFMDGKTAMWIDGDWALRSLREAKDVRWGVARLPILSETGTEPACLIAGHYVVLNAKLTGTKLGIARTYIERLLSLENQRRWAQSFYALPASLAALDDSHVQADPVLQVAAAQVRSGKAVGLSSGMQTAMEAMRGPLEDVMTGRIMPAEAARGMQARAEALALVR